MDTTSIQYGTAVFSRQNLTHEQKKKLRTKKGFLFAASLSFGGLKFNPTHHENIHWFTNMGTGYNNKLTNDMCRVVKEPEQVNDIKHCWGNVQVFKVKFVFYFEQISARKCFWLHALSNLHCMKIFYPMRLMHLPCLTVIPSYMPVTWHSSELPFEEFFSKPVKIVCSLRLLGAY